MDTSDLLNDSKRLLVFKNMGLKLLNKLRSTLVEGPYVSLFKNISTTDQNEVLFTYLGHNFRIQIEMYFSNDAIPNQAYLTTYRLPEQQFRNEEEILSYPFNLDYTVNYGFTIDNFAPNYILDFHQKLKQHYSESHKPFPIR